MNPHIVPIIGQKKTMGCWAAGFTMMNSWRSSITFPIEATLNKLGQSYIDAYNNNTGLQNNQVISALHKLELLRESPLNPTAAHWLQMINKSPLFVVVDEDPEPNLFAVHARVIIDIKNDSSNTVLFIDPAGNDLNGTTRSQTLSDFVNDYEQLAGSSWMGVQIIHY